MALAEMAVAGGIGAQVAAEGLAWAFGEDQARYVLTAAPEEATRIVAEAMAAGIPAARIGVTGGRR